MGEDKAPRIVVKPNIKQEDNGNKIVFNCQIEGSPEPEFKWFKNNTLVLESDRIKIKKTTTDGKLFNLNLEIVKLASDDSGQYKLTAKNRLGEVAASLELNLSSI